MVISFFPRQHKVAVVKLLHQDESFAIEPRFLDTFLIPGKQNPSSDAQSRYSNVLKETTKPKTSNNTAKSTRTFAAAFVAFTALDNSSRIKNGIEINSTPVILKHDLFKSQRQTVRETELSGIRNLQL
jgi:hypothetical protein